MNKGTIYLQYLWNVFTVYRHLKASKIFLKAKYVRKLKGFFGGPIIRIDTDISYIGNLQTEN